MCIFHTNSTRSGKENNNKSGHFAGSHQSAVQKREAAHTRKLQQEADWKRYGRCGNDLVGPVYIVDFCAFNSVNMVQKGRESGLGQLYKCLRTHDVISENVFP